jgi:hypothetical protein
MTKTFRAVRCAEEGSVARSTGTNPRKSDHDNTGTQECTRPKPNVSGEPLYSDGPSMAAVGSMTPDIVVDMLCHAGG